MPATPAWLASAEALLNRCIDASAQAGALARQLQGTSLQVDVEGVTRIRATAFNGRLALLAGDDSPADAVISGSPTALLQLFRSAGRPSTPTRPSASSQSQALGQPPFGGRPDPSAQGRSAQIRGDAELANRYRELFTLARPDLEEELSRFIGDLPARGLSRLARGALSWARHARRTAGENVAEYLQEEGRDLVTRPEVDEFLRGVDELRETADRVEARLAQLERRLGGGG